jgi:hypothetical protein
MGTETQPSWTRETPWRQGHVLPDTALKKLDLQHPDIPQDTCVVVIGHDCDLANCDLNAEPLVEIIVGRVVSPAVGTYMWSKSPRTLHLPFQRDGKELFVELVATGKQFLAKAELAAEQPSAEWYLTPLNLSVLRTWLAVRYNRAAFPDSFVTRMRKRPELIETRMAKILSDHREITAVYFDLDGGQNIERPSEKLYSLSIFLAFNPNPEPIEASDAADVAAAAIDKLFDEKCHDKKTSKWQLIELKKCVSISEDDLRVSQQRVLREWKLDYVSLKADAEQLA